MFASIMSGISSTFADILPQEMCWPCFFKGLAEGAAIGLLALAAIAAAPAAIATALVVTLAVVGVIGIAVLVSQWPTMNDKQKSEALGGIVGGLISGKFGPKLPPMKFPIPSVNVLSMVTSTGELVSVPVLSTTTGVISTTAPAAAAAAAGTGAVGTTAMMASSGGGGGSGSGDDGKKKGKIPDEEPTNLKEEKLLEEAKAGEQAGTNEPIQGGPTKPLGDAPRLVDNYGGAPEDWVKMRGPQSIKDGGVNKEVHYFKNTKTGQSVEFKFKKQIPSKPDLEPMSPTGQKAPE